MTSACIFCEIVAGRGRSCIVAERQAAVAFLDKYPINPGHTLVVPKQHSNDLLDMTGEDCVAVFSLAHRLAPVIREFAAPAAAGLNLIMCNGESADQSVSHAHVHLIPRTPGDGFEFKEAAKRPPPESDLRRAQQRIVNQLGAEPG